MKSLLIFTLGMCCFSIVRSQDTLYVSQNGNGSKDGSSWQDAGNDIQATINAASAGDQIWIASGSYHGPSNQNFNIKLKDGVSLYGGFSGTESTIPQRDVTVNLTKLVGGYSVTDETILSCTDITAGTVVDGFVFTRYVEPAHCRGIYLNNSSPLIKNCSFVDCVAYSGSATHGGNGSGIYMENSSSPQIVSCRFENNLALIYGGAVYIAGGSSPAFLDCQFIGNQASARGGAGYSTSSSTRYENCIFQNNKTTQLSANHGGGVSFEGGSGSEVFNCLFTGNTSDNEGAAINCLNTLLTVISCTITGNECGGEQGGGAIRYSTTSSGGLSIANSIVWNNPAIHADGSIQWGEITAVNGSAAPTSSHNLMKYGQYNSLTADPAFVDAANGNFQLSAASPAIDAGDNVNHTYAADAIDLAGHKRIINDTIDIGAYEAITNRITNNGEATFKGLNGIVDITGNAFENNLSNGYSWKMVVNGVGVDTTMLANPEDLAAWKSVLDQIHITFDSTHFVIGDLSQLPTILAFINPSTDWSNFAGSILISRVVYPNHIHLDSLLSNSELITISSALPVIITDFSGTLKSGIASIHWQSGVETSFDHFVLEKSTDGVAFSKVSTHEAKGNGSLYKARILQTEPLAYYRLKAVNKDGTANYYDELLKLTQQQIVDGPRIYPNPATTEIHIMAEAAGILVLYTSTGRQVMSVSLHAGLNEISIGHLSSGVYFGQVNGGHRFKLIKK